MTADTQLLRDYAARKSQDAFTELVRRHVDLVYSAALRQVRSPQLAEEVSQSVFTDLARTADKLKPNTILTAWLYQVARRTAIDVIRRESRRQARERLAVEMAAMNTAADWNHIEPLLEDAMETLDDADRAAILLRYFENKSLREVGQTLGTSDDAAQKRVSRAVDRLREYFSKRGVAIGAGGLVVLISANAVHAAPLALVSTISTAAVLAGTTIHASTTVTAAKIIAMTTMQKAFLTASIIILVGISAFEARQSSQLRGENQALQQQFQTSPTGEIQQLRQKNAELSSQLAALADQNGQLKTNTSELLKLRAEVAQLRENSRAKAQTEKISENEGTDGVAKSWTAKTELIKNYLRQNPSEEIPECQFMSERDWLSAIDPTASYWALATERDYRSAMEIVRSQAEGQFGVLLNNALRKFSSVNHQPFPTDFSQLQPYLDPAAADTLTRLYEIAPASEIPASALPNDGQLAADGVIRRKIPASKYGGKMVVLPWKQGSGGVFYLTCFSP